MSKLYSPSTLQSLCQKYQFKPAKILGQNFLIDQNILDEIVKSAEIDRQDTVLEIGPGFGVLTVELAKRAKKVIAVEKDKQLSQILAKDILSEFKNAEIINQDILKYNMPAELKKYKVVANLPYYISKPIIQKFISPPANSDNNCRLLVLLLQKEVAQKICAKPPDMNLLAVSVQFYAKPQIISCVAENSFWPKPTVASAILKITPLQKNDCSIIPFSYKGDAMAGLKFADLFFQLVKAGFGHKRKKLVSNLKQWLNQRHALRLVRIDSSKSVSRPVLINIEKILTLLDFPNTVRAQELRVEDWIKLTEIISSKFNPTI